MHNTILRILLAIVILAFSEGVINKQLVGKLETHKKLFALARRRAVRLSGQVRSRGGGLDPFRR